MADLSLEIWVSHFSLFAEHLNENVLSPYPHSHQVYTIPKRLRVYFKFNRKLNHLLYRAAWNAWDECIKDSLPECETGSVMALHTAGDLLNFHPHIHAICLHAGINSRAEFFEMPSVDNEYLQRIFARNVFSFLKDKGLLSDDDITLMKSWSHSGFNVFEVDPLKCPKCGGEMKIKAFLQDQKEITRLAQHLGVIPWRAPPPLNQSFPQAA